jgi:hypothetical protein
MNEREVKAWNLLSTFCTFEIHPNGPVNASTLEPASDLVSNHQGRDNERRARQGLT